MLQIAYDIRSYLGEVADKNLYYLHNNIDYLHDRIVHILKEKYASVLSEYDFVQLSLHPEGKRKERLWNPLPRLFNYGTALINRRDDESCSVEKTQYLA